LLIKTLPYYLFTIDQDASAEERMCDTPSSVNKIIKSTWTSKLRNASSFFSPSTWLGICKEASIQSSFVQDRRAPPFVTWIIHLIIPILILTVTLNNSSFTGNLKNGSIATLISPLSVGTILQIPEIHKFFSRLDTWRLSRLEADYDATLSLAQDIQSNCALRCDRFDVFFPPACPERMDEVQMKRKAMVFIPGALVSHTAYAVVASRLARDGNMIVVVMSLEPLRLASENLGAGFHDLLRVMKRIDKLWNEECRRRHVEQGLLVRNYEKAELGWCIGGHSYGGYTALNLAPQLDRYLKTVGRPERLKVVASAVGVKFLTDLSENENIDVLVINGSNDSLIELKTREAVMEFQSKLPPTAKCVNILGGTHHNFASYTPPAKFLELGGIGIAREKQHNVYCREILHFLLTE